VARAAELFRPAAAAATVTESQGGVSRIPHDLVCYAIGDIHGRMDLFEKLLAQIEADPVDAGRRRYIILLGDYVDRGPASREVLQTVVELKARFGDQVIALKGNHEEAMMDFLADASRGPAWFQHGGRATLASYGVATPNGALDEDTLEAVRQDFERNLPPSHRNLLENLPYFATIGDYVFVHAGVRPGVDMSEQVPEDLLWIREEFLSAERALAQTVVHGHTPSAEPVLADGRIGIDTGAYATGVLTAVKLIEDKVVLIKVTRR
jgi:serine/threonine protein phosphatase 1